jgi:hypothetical protein
VDIDRVTAKQAMARKPKPLKISVPKDDGRPVWMRVGVLSAVGLVLGMAWPTLAGVRIGPQVPGAKDAAVKSDPAAAGQPAPPALAASTGTSSTLIEGDDDPKRSNEQSVVVGGGTISRCFKGRDALKGEACGKLKVDRVFVPRLKELKRCASAVGLAGEMTLGFDIDFKKKDIHVLKGKSELPASTVRGIIQCAADYIRDVSAEKIPHKFTRYRVFYSLKFYPPGTAPPGEGNKDAGPNDADSAKSMASVPWDTALVRGEPKTGKVLMRLVRGTRVKILGRRKDWYRVKIREKEGWIYRGALGR